jgi:NAD(P)-dependent dehydrogenase (short-subunit alcohol dehydrogenase family)
MALPQHRTAVITGGSRGIGRAIAAAILGTGGRVMIAGRDVHHVQRAVDELGRECGDAQRVAGSHADVRDRASVESLMSAAAARFGQFDTLVNNAGIGRFGDVAALSDADWQENIETNLTGPFYCSRAAIPWLKQSGGGWIINIASLAGANPFAGGSAYCASKAALIAFSEAMMQELRLEDIRVSVILPGSVNTEFRSTHGDMSWKLTPQDVAQAVVDLLAYPARALPSRVEIRPAKPRTK